MSRDFAPLDRHSERKGPVRFGWALLAICALLAGCGRQGSKAGPEQVLRLSQRNEPATLDPQLASLPDEFFVLRALSEGLVSPAPDGVRAAAGGVVPGAATNWDRTVDGLTWVFHLRPEARWSNGDPVTASDFVFTFRRALNPALAAPKAPLFFCLKNAEKFYRGTITDAAQIGVAAPDEHTLVLSLEHPMPQLLAVAASGPWLPVNAAVVGKFGNTRDSAWTRAFVGNGPFILQEWRSREVIVVKRNPLFHDAARVHLDGIRFQVYDDENTEERAFRAGQVNVTMALPVSKIASYAAPILQHQPLAETRYLALNVGKPPLNDARVRRALGLAIDRTALVTSVLKGGQTAAVTLIPPGLGGYLPLASLTGDGSGTPQIRDGSSLGAGPSPSPKDEARRLLTEAGFPGGRGFPKLEISTWTNNPILEAIQQMWRKELGIETAVILHEAKVHATTLRSGDFAIGLVPAIPDLGDASALFGQFTTGDAGNYPHWSNARYDALVDEAGRTQARRARLEMWQKAEQILLADAPVVPLYFNAQNYLVSPRVLNWREDRLWTRFYLDVSLQP